MPVCASDRAACAAAVFQAVVVGRVRRRTARRRAVGLILPGLAAHLELEVGGQSGFVPSAEKVVSRAFALVGPVVAFVGVYPATQAAVSEIGPEVRWVLEG